MSAPVIEQQAAPNPATTAWVPVGPGPVVVVQPKTTVSAMSAGPPATPAAGDIWIATGISTQKATQFVSWQFCWDAGFSVWRFIGGPPMWDYGTGYQNTADGVWQFISANAPSIIAPRAGVYIFGFGGGFSGNNGVVQYIDVSNAALSNFAVGSPVPQSPGNSFGANISFPAVQGPSFALTLAAGEQAKFVSQSSSHVSTVVNAPWMNMLPIYIT